MVRVQADSKQSIDFDDEIKLADEDYVTYNSSEIFSYILASNTPTTRINWPSIFVMVFHIITAIYF